MMNSTFRLSSLVLCLLGGCQQSSTTPSAIANTDSLIADRTFFGVHHVITKNGIRSSVLDGDSAYLHAGSETLFITGVKLSFFNENGTQSGTLTSKKGEYDPAGGLFVAQEEVVLVAKGADGDRRIETDQLSYQVRTDELWSDQPFVMTHAGRTTRGSRFRSDGKFSTWNVTNAETTGGLPGEDSDFSF
ncbi:MAG: LPS export ABC transporter periplasmic protein LptC [Gemmatimonadetes bacterium]|nr:LPS export ABC transporter periplasmic protein LptC [Gemmatimonadota bacterium]